MNIKRINILGIISMSLCYVLTHASETVVKQVKNNTKKAIQNRNGSIGSSTRTPIKAPVKTKSAVQPKSVTASPTKSTVATHNSPKTVASSAQSTNSPEIIEVVDLDQEEAAPAGTKKIIKATQAQPSSGTVKNTNKAAKKTVKEAKKVHVDGIKSVVFGKESTSIITASDLKRPGLDGSLRTIDELELEALMYQDATAKKMLPDEDAIDRHLNTVRKENNDMSLDQLKQVFKSAGYTYAEGREQFKIMTAVNSILDFMIRSRLLVPEKEVRAYYEANPIYEDETYRIERAFVPFSTLISSNELYNQLVTYAQTGAEPSCLVEWAPSFWVNINDLAQEKRFITQLSVDQISQPVEISGGFELFKLKEKREHRLQPLEERYTEIANVLRKPRYEKLFEEYKQSLFGSSSIVRFD